jgi:hypothetical protein
MSGFCKGYVVVNKTTIIRMEIFEEILFKYDCQKRAEKAKTTFSEIEHLVKFKLPDDYKIYLENYLGFENTVQEEYVRLWDFDELIEMNKEYEIVDYLPNTLGIGTNGGGEFIAIEWTEKNKYSIILVPFIGMDEKQYHIEIGISFSDFLIRLDNGLEWFE